MATIKEPTTVGFVTTKDGDLESKDFAPGDPVRIIKTWDLFYLVKDDDGHYHNIKKELVDTGD